jgi:hypothetical protein
MRAQAAVNSTATQFDEFAVARAMGRGVWAGRVGGDSIKQEGFHVIVPLLVPFFVLQSFLYFDHTRVVARAEAHLVANFGVRASIHEQFYQPLSGLHRRNEERGCGVLQRRATRDVLRIQVRAC